MTDPSQPKEIERKFRVDRDALPFRLEERPSAAMEQGYIVVNTAEPREVRLRRHGGDLTLTAKIGGGGARGEAEIVLAPEQFDTLWPFTEGRRIRKTRYEIQLGDLTAELDVYGGRHEGLAVVEVEFPDRAAAEAFEPPDWFGGEVTDDPSYKNQRLAFT
ncbi:MAG: CYTH domain-containing protein [Puniceicoccaceae bacterium]